MRKRKEGRASSPRLSLHGKKHAAKRVKRQILPPAAKWKLKGANHATCKTRDQTPRQAQKDIGSRERVFPHKIKAISLGEGSRGTGLEVCLRRTPPEKAAVSLIVDRAHRCGRKAERNELQQVHPRAKKERSGTGSQDSCRSGGERCPRL